MGDQEGSFEDVSVGGFYSDLGITEEVRARGFRFVETLNEIVDEESEKVDILMIVKKWTAWEPVVEDGKVKYHAPVVPYWWEVMKDAAYPLVVGLHCLYPCTRNVCEQSQFRPFWKEVALKVIRARSPAAIVLCGNPIKEIWRELEMPKLAARIVDGYVPNIERGGGDDKDEDAYTEKPEAVLREEQRKALAAVAPAYAAARSQIVMEYAMRESGGNAAAMLVVMQRKRHPNLATWDAAVDTPAPVSDTLADGDPRFKSPAYVAAAAGAGAGGGAGAGAGGGAGAGISEPVVVAAAATTGARPRPVASGERETVDAFALLRAKTEAKRKKSQEKKRLFGAQSKRPRGA